MSRILVTGASGLLGLNFCMETFSSHAVTGIVHSHALTGAPFTTLAVDLQPPGNAAKLIEMVKPDAVLHCAALANLEACEADPVLACRLNAEVPAEIAAATDRLGIQMIHVSTDAVFDGAVGNYTEEDAPSPVGVYSRTKWEGEVAVLQANPHAMVARVNLIGWSLFGKRSLAEFFFNNLSAGRRVNGFTDVIFCPLLVNDLAWIFVQMIEGNMSGIYHTVSSTSLSKYDFGCRVARQFGLDETLISPCSWRDGGLQAVRSPNLNLRTDKLSAALGRQLPDVDSALEHFHRLYLDGYPNRLQGMAAGQ